MAVWLWWLFPAGNGKDPTRILMMLENGGDPNGSCEGMYHSQKRRKMPIGGGIRGGGGGGDPHYDW